MSDPFSTLDMPPRFDLDEGRLHEKFIQMSAATHPDRFTDPVEQAEAGERAAQVNEAYRVLSDPERRARALLEARRAGDDEEQAQKEALPPDLLMQMMEVREEMEQAIAADDRSTLDRLWRWAAGECTKHLRRVGELFAEIDQPDDPSDARPPTLPPATVKQVRVELNALRYFQRMLDQMPE